MNTKQILQILRRENVAGFNGRNHVHTAGLEQLCNSYRPHDSSVWSPG